MNANCQDFSDRLEALHQSAKTPPSEIDAAVLIFERLKTAVSICQSVTAATADASLVTAVFSELCAEARSGHGLKLRE